MRTAGNIRQKLKQVTYRHLQKLLTKRLSAHPVNCSHNGQVEIPDNGTPHEPLHICTYTGGDNGIEVGSVCDAKHGGVERARACPCFQARRNKDEIKDEFRSFFTTANHGEIAYLYPDVAALMWTLDGDIDFDDDTEEEPIEEEPSELPQAPSLETVEALATEGEQIDPQAEMNLAALALRAVIDGLPDTVERLVRTQVEGLLPTPTVLEARAVEPPPTPTKEEREAEVRQMVEDAVATVTTSLPAPPPQSWWGRVFGGR